MDKPELDKLSDYLAFLNQLEKDKQIPTKAMIPYLMRAFLELNVQQAWQVWSYWQKENK